MPYIRREERLTVDDLIIALAERLSLDEPGKINYAISKMLHLCAKEENYKNYNAIMGIISCVNMEFYRRVVAAYEDTKMGENEDVFL